MNRTCMILFSICLLAGSSFSADMDVIKQRVIEYNTAYGADREDPDIAAAVAALKDEAQGYVDSMQPDGSWSDLDYNETPLTDWPVGFHYRRLLAMIKAYDTEGQAFYQDASVLSKVELGLDFVHTYVYDGCALTGNTWWWNMGVPRELGPILVLLQDRINATVIAEATAAMSYLIGTSPGGTGMNRLWNSMNHFHYALVAENAERMDVVKTRITGLSSTTTAEGIQPDYSFHQHGAQVYTGGYGGSFAQDISIYFYLTEGTTYQVAADRLERITNYIWEGTAWGLYQNHFDQAIIGREITRKEKNGITGLNGLLIMANTPCSKQDQFIAVAKKILETWESPPEINKAKFYGLVKDSGVQPAWPTGHKHFPYSDYTVQRRDNYYMSVKMLSSRIIAAEMVNGEGTQSWHLSDGLTYVVLDGDEYFIDNVWPTMDWTRMPGTTVEKKYRIYNLGYGYGSRSFVGGVSTGEYGVSAMDFDANESELTAKKSWFFFEDEVVCLGSDITCPTANTVETVVNQRPLSAANAPLTVDGAAKSPAIGWNETMENITWAHCDRMGYYFPGGQTIQGKRENRSGTWESLVFFEDTTVFYNDILTFWFDHGTNASDKEYRYVMVPDVATGAAMADYVASDPITVLSHDSSIHAVRNNQVNAVGAVFWEPEGGIIDQITADTSCCVFYIYKDGQFVLSVSDPGQSNKQVTVTVNHILNEVSLPENASFEVSGASTVVTFFTGVGDTYTATFAMSDVLPPSDIAEVRDGTGADIDSTTLTTELSANWDESTDPEYGITRYWYAVGTSPGTADIVDWTSNGTELSVTATGLTLAGGTTYYVTVKAENGVGLQSTPVSSDGQWVDAETEEEDIQQEEIRVLHPNPYPISQGGSISFQVSGMEGLSELRIYTISGKLVKTLPLADGADEVDWDLLNEEGNGIRPGLYLYTIDDANDNWKTGKVVITR